jgi:hypothetical protein
MKPSRMTRMLSADQPLRTQADKKGHLASAILAMRSGIGVTWCGADWTAKDKTPPWEAIGGQSRFAIKGTT